MSTPAVTVLVLSAVLNVLLAALIFALVRRKGGLRYIGEQMGLVRTTFQPEPWQADAIERFRRAPRRDDAIVFAGDSFPAGAPWMDHLSNLRNRGLGGDTTRGLLQRLDEILQTPPTAIVLHVGTNDLNNGVPPAQVVANHEQILDRIRDACPHTRVLLLTLLPTNRHMRDSALESTKCRTIPAVNAGLRRLTKDYAMVDLLDLTETFSDEEGELARRLSHDGEHLNPDGYEIYCDRVKSWITGVEAAAPRDLDRTSSPR